MTSRRAAVVLGVTLAWIVSCSVPSDPPDAVARGFWSAVEARDWPAAAALCSAASDQRVEALFGERSVGSVSFGRTLSDADAALVETTFGSSDPETSLSFSTHLVSGGGGWRVDAERTATELRHASLATALEDFQQALRDGERVLSDVFEKGAREASEALQRAIEELNRALGGNPAL